MKMREVMEIRCTKTDKLLTHFDDTAPFKKSMFESMQHECVITIGLVGFEQKDHLFKVLISEKLTRLTFLKKVATRFYKEGNTKKAEKLYKRISQYFRSKDAKNNFQKEDEQ